MAEEMTKTQVEHETKDVRIQTSVALWRRFDGWWRSRGKVSRAEGIRTAMEEVTGSDSPSQA